MEDRDFDLPSDDQILHQVRSKRGTWGLSGSTRVLHNDARNGRLFTDHKYRRTADDCRARRGIGRDTP